MQHWTLDRDADDFARLTLDRAGASTNTLGAPVLAELNEALDLLDRDPPRGLVIVSGKANGFIAGADVDEFGRARKRGWRARARETRLGHLRAPCQRHLPDARPGARLLPGRRARAGARVSLSRRRRRARHPIGPARSDAGHRPGLGRHEAPAPADGRAGRARPDADGPHGRRAPGETARHRRRMRAGADHGKHRAWHPQDAARATTTRLSAGR